MFQMSLGSKELFHSNFLQWVSTEYRQEFEKLFEQLSGEKNLGKFDKCTRETKHIDLTLDYENATIFIENKIKSIATKLQLEKYSKTVLEQKKKTNSTKTICLFLGLTKPSFFDESNEFQINENVIWKYVSYKQLAGKMKDSFPNKYPNKDVIDYIEFIRHLSQLGNKLKVEPRDEFNYFGKNIEEWKDARIHDLYLKRKYQGMGLLLLPELQKLGINVEFGEDWIRTEKYTAEKKCFIKHSFNRGERGTLTLDYRINNKWTISIQLEGNTYRHCLLFAQTEKIQDSLKNNILKTAEGMKNSCWFDYSLKNRWGNLSLVKGAGTQKPQFNRYFTKRKDHQELFLCRYVQLEDKTVGEIVDVFVEDFKYIVSNEECFKTMLEGKP